MSKMEAGRAKAIVGRLMVLLVPTVGADKLLDFMTGFTGGLDIAIDNPDLAPALREALGTALNAPGEYMPFPADVLHYIVMGDG